MTFVLAPIVTQKSLHSFEQDLSRDQLMKVVSLFSVIKYSTLDTLQNLALALQKFKCAESSVQQFPFPLPSTTSIEIL